jgi:hypothetical protein
LKPIQPTAINDYYFSTGDPGLKDLYWLQLHAVGTGSFP